MPRLSSIVLELVTRRAAMADGQTRPSERLANAAKSLARETSKRKVFWTGLPAVRHFAKDVPHMIEDRITVNPNVMGGRLCIRGLRFPVSRLLGLRASGESEAEILQRLPDSAACGESHSGCRGSGRDQQYSNDLK
ncbi:MAG: DUF433 domain-containing protein [Phycisphaerae bacterium]|nr:DUF433 domain-containing protein [Phycisphaerae bacterium]